MALILLVQLQPGAGALSGNVERLVSTVTLDLRSAAWRPVPGDSYALVAGESGTVLQYTGKFFIKLQPNTTSDLSGVAWHPSGSKALLVGRDGAFLEFDGNGFRSAPFNTTFWFEDVKWRPQGDFALVAGHNGTLIRTEGSVFTHLNSTVNFTITSISWRPDGRFAFLCGDFPFVLRYDPETGQSARLETGVSGQFLRGVSWRPDGGAALVFGTLGNLFRYDGSGFTPLNSPTANQWLAGAWSPDNRTALLAARGGLLYRFEEGKALAPITTNTTQSIHSIAYTLNGSYALCAGSGGLVLRYPPTETPLPNPPVDGDDGSDWLLLSAVLVATFALMTVGVAVYMSLRARRKQREADELADAELHAVELAAQKKGPEGT
jgi:WD40 repeat protein